MTEPPEPKSLKDLLFEAVDSFEELGILIWFHDHADGAIADAKLLSEQTMVPPEAADTALAALAARGMLSEAADQPGKFVYAPDVEKQQAVDRIVLEYRANMLQVMGLMTANAIERVRTGAWRAFADSFRIKGPKSNG